MPSSITFSLTLLFIYALIPSILQKFFYNKYYPLRTFNLHISEDIILFGVPTAIILIAWGVFFNFIGYRLDYEILTAAFGNPQGLKAELLSGYLSSKINWLNVGLIWFSSIAYGVIKALLDLESKPDGSKLGIIDPWFEVFHRLRGLSGGKISVDIMTKSKVLYSGNLDSYLRDRNGELTAISLKEAYRYYSPADDCPDDSSKKKIPGNQMHFLAADISNINLTSIEYMTGSGSALSYDFILKDGRQNQSEILKNILIQSLNRNEDLKKMLQQKQPIAQTGSSPSKKKKKSRQDPKRP